FLAREGVSAEVVDRGDFGQEASWAGAGILPPGNPERARTPFDLLRAHSAALYPGLSAELRERTGIENGYLRCGGLEIPGAREEAGAEEWRGEGIACEPLQANDVRRLEPALSDTVTTAYHLPDMAQVRNPRHVKALLAGCRSHGVRFRPGCPAHGWEREGARIT